MAIQFLSFDIDDTLLPSHQHSQGFIELWRRLKFENPPLLCYNTGRLRDDTLRLIQQGELPRPDYLICGVGTMIHDINKGELLVEFSQILEQGWDIKKVSDILLASPYKIEKQPQHFQNPYKSSWFLNNATDEEIEDIRKLLRQNTLDVNVIYSSVRHLDILPKWANKGNSLQWLLDYLAIDPNDAIVAGNSGNDAAMYTLPGIKGIIVGNAQPELIEQVQSDNVYQSNKLYEEAILDGLYHFGIQYQLGEPPIRPKDLDVDLIKLSGVDEIKSISAEQLQLIKHGYEKAIEALHKNITPIGFSACSIDDNEFMPNELKQRSVWARDGAMTIIGTMDLADHPEIFACQRKTLETILDNLSENGQVPTCVSIDTLLPEYSDEQDISSIDSGLWVVIAFHDYVKGSGDIDFLRQRLPQIDRIMMWLSANDSNNDALLEIPEAGDWMNRKGRSYHVMYDEILWYWANVCTGRLHELLNHKVRTGKYITWSQVIKNSIIKNFWPSFGADTPDSYGLTGEANYLIAQKTPFGYSSRCDILGNVLAYLFDVVDKNKAVNTFRYIWSIGASDPYPVKNIYPAILTDNPDQRPFFNTNLINLPYHYHNGGIWPFVGGAWVRYIQKLEMEDLAMKELAKLATLNSFGIFSEWEFNEWHHGITGRPVGKRFQTLSASEYIHACHELGVI